MFTNTKDTDIHPFKLHKYSPTQRRKYLPSHKRKYSKGTHTQKPQIFTHSKENNIHAGDTNIPKIRIFKRHRYSATQMHTCSHTQMSGKFTHLNVTNVQKTHVFNHSKDTNIHPLKRYKYLPTQN